MKASPQEQLRLLELADLDAELDRLDNRRRTLPEHAEVQGLEAREAAVRDGIVAAQTDVSDLAREQAKAESDVDQVRARADRDRKRLDAGQVSSPRDLENLQSEIESLKRRQADLEEIVLDIMERREATEGRLTSRSAERARLASEHEAAVVRRDTALAEMNEQTEKIAERRSGLAAEVPDDVLALYRKLRQQHGGVGAAALRRGRCEGCHLALNTVDLNHIRAADPDEVIRCEECRRILVRTPESGL